MCCLGFSSSIKHSTKYIWRFNFYARFERVNYVFTVIFAFILGIPGNDDGNSIVYHDIAPAITARFIRVHPTGWERHISMRVEFHGCFIWTERRQLIEIIDIECVLDHESCLHFFRKCPFKSAMLNLTRSWTAEL